jgi:kinetochore protein Spc7/SPC105
MNFNNPDDEGLSSSPFSGRSTGDADEAMDDDEDGGSNSNSGSDDDDGTMMSIDGGETTDISVASIKSASSGSSVRLEEALRQAARQAGTQGIDFDEHGDTEMAESEDEEVVASFAPFKKNIVQNLESQQDQENVIPFSPAFKAGASAKGDQSEGEEMTMDMTHAVAGIIPGYQADDDGLSMDVTRAFGGIISNEAPKASSLRRKSAQPGRRQSTRRRSSGEISSLGDETMDLTIAMERIQSTEDETVSKDNEDMTMELTSVVGGVLLQSNAPTRSRRRSSMVPPQRPQNRRLRESLDSNTGDDTMDITVAIGGIMPSIAEATGELDTTAGMDMTTAIGGILSPQLSTGKRSQAKKVMELETDLGSSPFQAVVAANSPPKGPVPVHTIASETGSPTMAAFRGKGLRRSTDAGHSTTPKSKLGNETPVKDPITPSRQITPQPARPATPGKTPPSENVVMRTSSPKRLFKDEIRASSTPLSRSTKTKATPNKLFQKDKETGVATPNFVLTPQRRISSGVGIDKEGLGSPKVAALLDRRGSIGDHARSFVPSISGELGHGVHFDDPRTIEQEVNREREQEEDRENGRKILEREANQHEEEKDGPLNLKEMIQSLTPKKKSLKGRKSLHVGAAKGILGKRPVELDEDDDEDNCGIKRLKAHQGSPVKNVKLQGPPSRIETTGRLTRAARKSLENASIASTTPTTSSPEKIKATTPRDQRRFKDVEVYASSKDFVPFTEKEPVGDPEIIEESHGDDRIQLEDFLNMTSIRFMELTTTKRRHTVAPKALDSRGNRQDNSKVSLEDCVAAGAATIPMLELFQHVRLLKFQSNATC